MPLGSKVTIATDSSPLNEGISTAYRGMFAVSKRACSERLMNYVEWQRRRSRLNHDWLKNWLMPALSKLLRMANGQISDQRYSSEFSNKLRREWPERQTEFMILAEAFPHAMSTANYFDEGPLSNLPPEDEKWMRDVTHQRWLRSYPVDKLTHAFLEKLNAANDSCMSLMSALEQEGAPLGLVDTIVRFQLSCKALGDSVSEFPSKPEFERRPHD